MKAEEVLTAETIAQWVIDNRYPKSEHEKLSDFELYHGLVEKIKANFETAYGKGYEDATREACKEIHKNYIPNER